MSRNRTLKTEKERTAFDNFLLAHSGQPCRARLCSRHPAIARMTYSQLAEAMQDELGFVPTRQSVAKVCRELGIPRRHRPGPAPLPEGERRQAAAQRDVRYRSKLRQDPEAWKDHLRRKREAHERWLARLRKDPEAWEAFLKRRRKYLRGNRRKQREPVAVG